MLMLLDRRFLPFMVCLCQLHGSIPSFLIPFHLLTPFTPSALSSTRFYEVLCFFCYQSTSLCSISICPLCVLLFPLSCTSLLCCLCFYAPVLPASPNHRHSHIVYASSCSKSNSSCFSAVSLPPILVNCQHEWRSSFKLEAKTLGGGE